MYARPEKGLKKQGFVRQCFREIMKRDSLTRLYRIKHGLWVVYTKFYIVTATRIFVESGVHYTTHHRKITSRLALWLCNPFVCNDSTIHKISETQLHCTHIDSIRQKTVLQS